MKTKFYEWFKMPVSGETHIEKTKDYFSDNDEYINEKNGWTKNESKFIEIEDGVNNEKK